MLTRLSIRDIASFGMEKLGDPLYRNAFFLMLNSALGGGFGFAFWLLVVQFYPSTAVGVSVSLLALAGLIGALSSLGFGQALIRFLPSAKEDTNDRINTSITLALVTAVGVGLIFLASIEVWSPSLAFVKDNLAYGLMFVAFAAAFALTPILESSFLAARRASYVLHRSLIYNGLRLAILVAVVSSLGAFGIFFSVGAALLLAFLVGLIFLLPRLYKGFRAAPSLRLDGVRDMITYSSGNHAANLLSALPRGLLPIMVLAGLSASSSAYFYIAWMIASFLFVIPGASAVSAFIEGSQPGNHLRATTVRSLRFGLILVAPGVVFLLLGGHLVLGLFGVEYSAQGTELLRILALSSFFVAINSIFFTYLRVHKKIGELILLSAALGIGTLVASYFLLGGFGLLGLGIAFLSVQGAISAYVLLRNLGTSMEIAKALVRI